MDGYELLAGWNSLSRKIHQWERLYNKNHQFRESNQSINWPLQNNPQLIESN